jgi:hypothetical protein
MAPAKVRFLFFSCTAPFPSSHNIWANPAMSLYKQVGLFLIWMQSKNGSHWFLQTRSARPRQRRGEPGSRQGAKHKLSAAIENIVTAGADLESPASDLRAASK